MNVNFEYIDLPKLPQEIIDDIFNTINECKLIDVPANEKYPTWQSFRPSKHVRDYIVNLINNDGVYVLEHDVHISFLNGNLPIHNDTCRDTAFNYVIQSGGKTMTNFWSDDMQIKTEAHNIEEHRWHRLNVKKNHSVDIEVNPRIIITVGTPWKNRVNTDMIIDTIENNPGGFIDVYKRYCNRITGTVFDFGTSDGASLVEFSKEFPKLDITGFEGSKILANIAKEKLNVEHKRFMEITSYCDCVISSYTLHHQHDANGNFWMPIKLISLRANAPVHVCVLDYERPLDTTGYNNEIKSAYTKEEVEEQLSRLSIKGLTVTTEPIDDKLNRLIVHGVIDER